MNEIGKYTYGIISSDSPAKNFDTGVYTISYQDISAVVSDSEIIDYINMPKNTLGRQLIRHQGVIEGIMAEHTIIPMKLGTFAVDEDEVRDILERGYSIIKDIFNKIADKIEIDLAVTWNDFNSILKEVGEEKEIKELKEGLLANPEGVSVDDQMKLGVMIKKALDEKRERCAGKIENALKAIICDFRVHELMDDKMVSNSAFLIDKYKQKDFDKKIDELNAEFGEKLNFRCVCPLPPYSFYTLETKRMRFEEVDWARKKLGLNGSAAKEEIKKAYQTKAFSSHPDRNPDTSEARKVFDEVTNAYRILSDYCQNDSCSFKEQDFKENSLIVRLRG